MKVHDTEKADGYEAEHPAVRTHPDTGRKALYLSRSHTIRFQDMSEEESRPLIDFLQAHQTRPGIHLPRALVAGHADHLGQPLHPAQRGERLSRPAPPHAPPDRGRADARLAFLAWLRKRHAVRQLVARRRERFGGTRRRAFLGRPGR